MIITNLWHGFEFLMMAFHGFIWGRLIIRKVWARITISNTNHYKKDIDIKSTPMKESTLTSLFKEAYGDKIMDLIPMETRAGYIIRNKDGTKEEIGYEDLTLAVKEYTLR